jgi:hypothetical protein
MSRRLPVLGKTQSLALRILDEGVFVSGLDEALYALVAANFAAMAATCPSQLLRYNFTQCEGGVALSRNDEPIADGLELDQALFELEEDLILALQRRRQDLLFLHSAAVEFGGKAFLLVAASGSGKSTTVWGLLHAGFGYLSDELGPVDLGSLRVWPYAHALCLKREPPRFRLPATTVNLGTRLYVPVASIPAPVVRDPMPLGGVFLIHYGSEESPPAIQPLSASAAAARMYVNTLNALAHSKSGLDAVVRIAQRVPCFAVATGELRVSCMMLREHAEALAGGKPTGV